MKQLLAKLKRWWRGPEPCRHEQNYNQTNWVLSDGTLMMYFSCLDCNYCDRGHVYGGDDGQWTCVVQVRGGVVTFRSEQTK